ncbi:MAG: flagellar hook-associated protein FlgK [Desulfobulbaceae bacterium]|nr:flagellar hook-associated protein FlgK [Desulfobulbaceae bacterium]
MSGIINALNLGKSGLLTGQKALEIAGNNISNVNTPGYSREVPIFTAFPSIMIQGVMVGTGSGVSNIAREHDAFLARQIQDKSASLGAEEGKAMPLTQVENTIGISENSLAVHIDGFFNAWQDLSADPGNQVARANVLESGTQLASAFSSAVDGLRAIQRNLDVSLGAKVVELNAKFKEVADLNKTIAGIEAGGPTALSARDRRDLLLQEISYALGGTSIESDKGMASFYLPNGLPVVQDGDAFSLGLQEIGNVQALQLNLGSQAITLSPDKVGGEVNGLLSVRDQVIPDLINNLDKLAFTMANQVNAAHQLGSGLDGVAGRDFFNPLAVQLGAATSLTVALGNYNQVAAGLGSATGDNTNALAITALGGGLLIDGSYTFSGYYAQLATDLGSEVSSNKMAVVGNKDSLDLISNLRDNTVGVSIEEEMISLIRYQKGYEASAKYLTVVNDMLDTLLNVGR